MVLTNAQKLATFLKVLYDLTKDEHMSFSMSKELKARKVPYVNVLSQVLIQKGIAELQGKGKAVKWKWISKAEPNIIMAQNLLDACAKWSVKEKKSIPNTSEGVRTLTFPNDFDATLVYNVLKDQYPDDVRILGRVILVTFYGYGKLKLLRDILNNTLRG